MPDIEQQRLIYLERKRKRFISFGFLLFFFVIFALSAFSFFEQASTAGQATENMFTSDGNSEGTFLQTTGIMKDTVYTDQPSFIEVELDQQQLLHRWKNGAVDTIKISTGTARLTKGIETRQGIFVIQNKIPWLYSLQFDSTKVYNWLGFNWGIGFHSLGGRGYYRHLGVRPSSHGCIRVGRNDAERLFHEVGLGTLVYVHKGASARVASFLPEGMIIDTTSYSSSEVASLYSKRLQSLYDGTRLSKQFSTVLLRKGNTGHSGLPIGDFAKVPLQQKIPSLTRMSVFAAVRTTKNQIPPVPRWEPVDQSATDSNVEGVILP